jgi:hypothetical protein
VSVTPKTVSRFAVAYAQLGLATVDLLTCLPRRLTTGTSSAEASAAADERSRLRSVLWRLERGYEQIVGEDPRQFALSASELAGIIGRLRPAILLWVDILESLAQDAERQFGPQAGKGPMKSQVVRSALAHLLIDSRIRLRDFLPDGDTLEVVRPLILGRVSDWTLDFIVHLLNTNDAWEVSKDARPEAPPRKLVWTARSWMGRLIRWTLVLFRPLIMRMVAATSEEALPVTPEVAELMQTIRQRGADPDALFGQLGALLRWMAENRGRIRGIVEVISVGLKEAQSLLDKSSAERQGWVRNFVMIFLEDEGIVDPASVFYEVIESLVETAIEAVTMILERRRVLGSGLLEPA